MLIFKAFNKHIWIDKQWVVFNIFINRYALELNTHHTFDNWFKVLPWCNCHKNLELPISLANDYDAKIEIFLKSLVIFIVITQYINATKQRKFDIKTYAWRNMAFDIQVHNHKNILQNDDHKLSFDSMNCNLNYKKIRKIQVYILQEKQRQTIIFKLNQITIL